MFRPSLLPIAAAATVLLAWPSYGQGGLPVEHARLTDAPDVPPAIARKTPARVIAELEIKDVVAELDDGVKYTFWTYGGHVPGKFIRVRQGDLVEFHLKNKGTNMVPHNIDLHAVTGPGGGAKVTRINPGEEATFEWKALKSGLYVYHCAGAPVPMHLANGLYGLILVEPERPLPKVDKEFYLMQSEFYLEKGGSAGAVEQGTPQAMIARVAGDGLFGFSFEKALAERPDYVVWNGRVGSLTGENALKVKCGEKVRFYIGNGGLSLSSAFHIIGDHLEKVYAEGSLDSPPLLNIQTHLIAPGAAAVVDTSFEVPGAYLLVDHSLARTFNKGCLGTVRAEGPEQPDVFKFVSKKTYEDTAAQPMAFKLTARQAAALNACMGCHDLSPERKRIAGPGLFGVFGRAPSISEVPYQQWTEANLDQYLRDPSRVKRNTPMAFRVSNELKRKEVIEALESLR